MKIDMHTFPKYWDHIKNDDTNSWEEALWIDGFNSARQDYGSRFVELNEKDYTLFILKYL